MKIENVAEIYSARIDSNLKDCLLSVLKTRLGHIPVYLIGQDNHVTQMDELEKTERQNSNSRKSD